LHGAVAAHFGAGLIAEDLSEELPGELARLKKRAVQMGKTI
jgi:hypothetical protein